MLRVTNDFWFVVSVLLSCGSHTLATVVVDAADAAAAVADNDTKTSTAAPHPVISWMESKSGGYFNHDKIIFKQGGMFATQDIHKGELLFVVPKGALFGPTPDDLDFDDGDGGECETARRLAYEYHELGPPQGESTQSDYWPYLKYVFEDFAHDQLPLAWSESAKQLMRKILGQPQKDDDAATTVLEPQNFAEGDYASVCGETYYEEEGLYYQDHKDLLHAAWRIVASRGWIHVMVPVYDMMNHRNGERHHNVDRQDYEDDDGYGTLHLNPSGEYRIVAFRNIKAGQQLHNSYNQCVSRDVTCAYTHLVYMTPHIFNDYGFVEQFPQRYNFFTGFDANENLGLIIDIDQDDSAVSSSSLPSYKITWVSTLDEDDNDNDNDEDNHKEEKSQEQQEEEPNEHQIAWLATQYKRLLAMEDDVRKRVQYLVHFEARAILDYFEALKTVLDQAVQQAPKRSSLNHRNGTTATHNQNDNLTVTDDVSSLDNATAASETKTAAATAAAASAAVLSSSSISSLDTRGEL